MAFQFYRYNSTGNTFFLCDLQTQPFDQKERPALVKRLCQGYLGFQTDGVIFLQTLKPGARYLWDFYNADGSQAEMCGNASRVVPCFLKSQDPSFHQAEIQTAVGLVEVGCGQDNHFDSSWSLASLETNSHWDQEFEFQQQKVPYDYFNTGVPHGVVELDPYPELAKSLRHSDAHSKKGMNVTFVEAQGLGEVSAVTFERGVEDFTLSCGTGAVAAALWSRELSPELSTHQVQMPGGLLTVTFLVGNRIKLSGEVLYDFKIEIE
jgi:diaminopimelate epimerase